MSNKSYFDSKAFRSIMFIVTGVGMSIVTIGGLFVALHWTAGHVVLSEALSTAIFLCVLWLIFLPKLSPLTPKLNELRGTKAGKYLYQLRVSVYMLLTGGLVLSVGAFFRLMHWPGGGWLLMIGCFTVACLFIIMPLLYDKYINAAEEEKLQK